MLRGRQDQDPDIFWAGWLDPSIALLLYPPQSATRAQTRHRNTEAQGDQLTLIKTILIVFSTALSCWWQTIQFTHLLYSLGFVHKSWARNINLKEYCMFVKTFNFTTNILITGDIFNRIIRKPVLSWLSGHVLLYVYVYVTL